MAAKKPKNDAKEMDVAISVKVPLALREKAQQKTKETGIAVSFIVRKSLEEWVNEEAKGK